MAPARSLTENQHRPAFDCRIHRLKLASHKPRVQAAGDTLVGGAFDDGPAVGEEGDFVGGAPEFQDEIVVLYLAVGSEPGGHFCEIYGAVALVDLDGVAATERDLGAAFSGEIDKLAGPAGGTIEP